MRFFKPRTSPLRTPETLPLRGRGGVKREGQSGQGTEVKGPPLLSQTFFQTLLRPTGLCSGRGPRQVGHRGREGRGTARGPGTEDWRRRPQNTSRPRGGSRTDDVEAGSGTGTPATTYGRRHSAQDRTRSGRTGVRPVWVTRRTDGIGFFLADLCKEGWFDCYAVDLLAEPFPTRGRDILTSRLWCLALSLQTRTGGTLQWRLVP